MSKYSVVSELVRIANTLDESGFVREASAIDKVAKKIVTSSVDETTYKKDIDNYRKLISDYHFAKDPTEKQQLLQQATNQYNGVLNSMWSRYDRQQKQAWMAQSNRIRNEFIVGEGTNAAPGYATTKGFLEKTTQDFIDERVMNLGTQIDSYMSENPNTKEDPWDKFFKPIRDQLIKQKKLNSFADDYLNRTFSILMAKHRWFRKPDKPAHEF
jgi:hypothetical protein